ncbi:hypothetical protein, partial [Streptomyces mirabilis]|uniref:hypothetical protein n=1 Tax=Streptomyces mirabilis TaxID=68239 RepID=UPI0036B687A8
CSFHDARVSMRRALPQTAFVIATPYPGLVRGILTVDQYVDLSPTTRITPLKASLPRHPGNNAPHSITWEPADREGPEVAPCRGNEGIRSRDFGLADGGPTGT